MDCWFPGLLLLFCYSVTGTVARTRLRTGYTARSRARLGVFRTSQPNRYNPPSSPRSRSWGLKYTSEDLLDFLNRFPGGTSWSPSCRIVKDFWSLLAPFSTFLGHVGRFSVLWTVCWLFLAQFMLSWGNLALTSPNLVPTCPNLPPTSPNLVPLRTNLLPF